MNKEKIVSVVQVFESYPLFYQPYIPPVIKAIQQSGQIKLQINAFTGKGDKDVLIMPSYYKRKLYEIFYAVRHKNKPVLNYAEIQYVKQGVDVVHLQHSFLFSKVKGLLELPKNERPKIIITLRGGDTYVKPWLSKKWQEFYKHYGPKVDGFITMSQHQKQYLNEKWGIDNNQIHVIPISFGTAFLAKPKKPNENVIKIISAFRMCWEKNIDGNLRTIKHLNDSGLTVQYDIYGDGKDAGQVMYLIDKYKLKDCVTFHGKIDNSDLKARLAHYDFFLQLSHSEALPTSVIEAQSYGVPAIVSNSGGLPEAIIDTESGYCVPAHDAKTAAECMVALWSDESKFQKFSTKAIEKSKCFSVDVEVERLTTLYKKISQI